LVWKIGAMSLVNVRAVAGSVAIANAGNTAIAPNAARSARRIAKHLST
jgi:hypothetical protein